MEVSNEVKAIYRPPVKYYGGKQRMLKHLLPLIPEHRIYVEAFAGGAALFWAKKPSKIEVLSDINGNVANFYKCMRDEFDSLHGMILNTLHCEHTFYQCKEIYNNPSEHNDVVRAWAFFVACNMSYAAEAAGSFQWVRNKTDNWHPAVSVKNRRLQFEQYRDRLSLVSIRDRRAEQLIMDMDCPDAFFYCDPPYVGARQGHYEGYKQEDFDELLSILSNIDGKFLLSSYDNHELDRYVEKHNWIQVKFNQRLGVQGGTGRKVEVLTRNYE